MWFWWYRCGYYQDFSFDEIDSADLKYLGVTPRGASFPEKKALALYSRCFCLLRGGTKKSGLTSELITPVVGELE